MAPAREESSPSDFKLMHYQALKPLDIRPDLL